MEEAEPIQVKKRLIIWQISVKEMENDALFFTKDLCWIGAGVLYQLLHIVLHLDTVNQNADEHSQEMLSTP